VVIYYIVYDDNDDFGWELIDADLKILSSLKGSHSFGNYALEVVKTGHEFFLGVLQFITRSFPGVSVVYLRKSDGFMETYIILRRLNGASCEAARRASSARTLVANDLIPFISMSFSHPSILT
jgi:hypothetical protein